VVLVTKKNGRMGRSCDGLAVEVLGDALPTLHSGQRHFASLLGLAATQAISLQTLSAPVRIRLSLEIDEKISQVRALRSIHGKVTLTLHVMNPINKPPFLAQLAFSEASNLG
jgi:hypothetical protein